MSMAFQFQFQTHLFSIVSNMRTTQTLRRQTRSKQEAKKPLSTSKQLTDGDSLLSRPARPQTFPWPTLTCACFTAVKKMYRHWCSLTGVQHSKFKKKKSNSKIFLYPRCCHSRCSWRWLTIICSFSGNLALQSFSMESKVLIECRDYRKIQERLTWWTA